MHSDTNLALVNSGSKSRHTRSLFSVVAIGGSAGGLEAVGSILNDLPKDFASPILVVIHLHPNYSSHAADILRRHTKLKVKDAQVGDRIEKGIVYLATPDRHLLVNKGIVELSATPAVNFSRPAIDATFASVVKAYGAKVIGVILSGSGRDGAEGVRAIKAAGGFVIVEDPLTARFAAMPSAAVSASAVDCVLPLKDIAPRLLQLSSMVEGTAGR